MSLGSKVLTKLEMGILKFLPFLLLLHLISYIDVECAQIKCKIGVERYHNGDCVKCTCSEGDGLSISQVGQGQTWPQNIAKEKKSIITTTNLTIAQNDFFVSRCCPGTLRCARPARLARLMSFLDPKQIIFVSIARLPVKFKTELP